MIVLRMMGIAMVVGFALGGTLSAADEPARWFTVVQAAHDTIYVRRNVSGLDYRLVSIDEFDTYGVMRPKKFLFGNDPVYKSPPDRRLAVAAKFSTCGHFKTTMSEFVRRTSGKAVILRPNPRGEGSFNYISDDITGVNFSAFRSGSYLSYRPADELKRCRDHLEGSGLLPGPIFYILIEIAPSKDDNIQWDGFVDDAYYAYLHEGALKDFGKHWLESVAIDLITP